MTEVVPVRLLAPLRAVAPRPAAPTRAILEHGLVGPADEAPYVVSERLLHEGVALLVLALDLEPQLSSSHSTLSLPSAVVLSAVDAVDAVDLLGRLRLFFLGMA